MTDTRPQKPSKPCKPSNYDRLDFTGQVAHHVAVIRWRNAHPDLAKAEDDAQAAADEAAERARRLAHNDHVPVTESMIAEVLKSYGDEVTTRKEAIAKIAKWNAVRDKQRAELEARWAEEDASEAADAAYVAKYSTKDAPEPPQQKAPKGVSFSAWYGAIDAWDKAHPEIIAKRQAKEEAENAAWRAKHPKQAAQDEREQAEREEMMAKATAKVVKRQAKNPQAALERERESAQRDMMDEDRNDAKREARESGETWGEISEEWEAEWIENNWRAEDEASFLVEFEERWLKDHGSPFPTAERVTP